MTVGYVRLGRESTRVAKRNRAKKAGSSSRKKAITARKKSARTRASKPTAKRKAKKTVASSPARKKTTSRKKSVKKPAPTRKGPTGKKATAGRPAGSPKGASARAQRAISKRKASPARAEKKSRARAVKLPVAPAGGRSPSEPALRASRNSKPHRARYSKDDLCSSSRGGDSGLADPNRAIPKTRLTAKQLGSFKEVLLKRRRQMSADARHLVDDAFNRRHGDRSDHTSMPIHMADVGSDNWEQEFDLMLMDNERAMLREIDDALQRIEDRTYGVCLATHRPISIARLSAKPWARYCIEYARLREQGRAP